MADVEPFPALRYAPNVDLAAAICPPFDVISPQQQRALYQRSPANAVRLELAQGDGDRYQRAASTLQDWLKEGVLRRDDAPALYLYREQFRHAGKSYRRLVLFARLRLEEWQRGVILPHEETFGGPKEDRLKLLRAIRVNTSPVHLLYRDGTVHIQPLLAAAESRPPLARFTDAAGQPQALWRIDDQSILGGLADAFAGEKLYVADGHHRYETALAYRDECRAAAPTWTGSEPENFALAALTAADDPGLLVLPIHRLTNVEIPLERTLGRLSPLFGIEVMPSPAALMSALSKRGRTRATFGLAAAESPDVYLLSLSDVGAVANLLPQDKPPAWRELDATIATYAVLRHGLQLNDAQMSDYSSLWFTEDAGEALHTVREGGARYALLLNPVPVRRILAVADAGKRMPPKSTFFYPKVPTGLVFNPLDD
ncbi:MAG: DUF1015 domain-containing protein [Chloroflexi bacterium]|nr:DUF1015 domain-containing protein [Chloroflexota bacterium]